jgi:DNA-binding transcriptional LysR family regulator
MDTSWDDLRLFLAVAETGSLSQAARRLRVGQPTVSRRLAQLEEQVGYALCDRSSDGIRLTPMGERLIAPLRRMAEGAAAWEDFVEHLDAQPQGTVRITAPPGIAHDFLVPFAAELRDRHAKINLQILARIQFLDLARREAELAIRMRPTEQKELEVLFEMESPVGAFAAPKYAAFAAAASPNEVAYIGWAPPYDDLPPNPQLAAAIENFSPAFACDDYLVQCRAAELGLGVIFLPLVRHRFALDRGLQHIPELDPGPEIKGPVQLIASKAALSLPKVRLVADALVAELRQIQSY